MGVRDRVLGGGAAGPSLPFTGASRDSVMPSLVRQNLFAQGYGGAVQSFDSRLGTSSSQPSRVPRLSSAPAPTPIKPWTDESRPSSGGSKSFFGQLAQEAGEFIPGMRALATGVIKAPYLAGRAAYDAADLAIESATGRDILPGRERISPIIEANVLRDNSTADTVRGFLSGAAREYAPLPTAQAESMSRTLDVGGLRGDTDWIVPEYKKASDEGRIVSKVLEDVGNVSLLAGGAGAVLGRPARALGVAPRTAGAATRGVSQSPFLNALRGTVDKARMPLRTGPSKGIVDILERRRGRTLNMPPTAVEAAVGRAGEVATKIGWAGELLDPSTPLLSAGGMITSKLGGPVAKAIAGSEKGQKLGKNMQERRYAQQINRAQREMTAEGRKVASESLDVLGTKMDELGYKPKSPETALAGSVMLNVLDNSLFSVLRMIERNVDGFGELAPQQILDTINKTRKKDNHITLAQVEGLQSYYDGTMRAQTPQIARAIDEGVAAMRSTSRAIGEARVATGSLAPEYLDSPRDNLTGQELWEQNPEYIEKLQRNEPRTADGRFRTDLEPGDTTPLIDAPDAGWIDYPFVQEWMDLQSAAGAPKALELTRAFDEAETLQKQQLSEFDTVEAQYRGLGEASALEAGGRLGNKWNLEAMTVAELRKRAGEESIPGRSSMNKAQLLENLQQSRLNAPDAAMRPDIYNADDPYAGANQPEGVVSREQLLAELAEEAAAADPSLLDNSSLADLADRIARGEEGLPEPWGERGARSSTEAEAIISRRAVLASEIAHQADVVREAKWAMENANLRAENVAKWVIKQSDWQTNINQVNTRYAKRLQRSVGLEGAEALGGRVKNADGKGHRLTGMLQRIAKKNGLEAALLEQIRVIYAQQLGGKSDIAISDRFDGTKGPIESTVVHQAMNEVLLDNVPAGDRVQLIEAMMTDDMRVMLDSMMDPAVMEGNMLATWEMYNQLRHRINSYVGEFDRVSTDVLTQIDQVATEWFEDWTKQINEVNDVGTRGLPASLRQPLIQGRLAFQQMAGEAQKFFANGEFDVANQYMQLAESATTSMSSYLLQGGSQPVHIATGPANLRTAQVPNQSMLTPPVDSSSQYRERGERPTTVNEFAAVQVNQLAAAVVRESLIEVANGPFSKSVREIAAVSDEIANRGDVRFADVVDMLEAEGYVPVNLDPGGKFPEVIGYGAEARIAQVDAGGVDRMTGYGEAGGAPIEMIDSAAVMDKAAGMEIRVIPKRLHDTLLSYRKRAPDSIVWYDQLQQLFKVKNLAWSTTWLINNVVGNAAMATFSAGLTPGQSWKHHRELKSMVKEVMDAEGATGSPMNYARRHGTLSELMPASVAAGGQSYTFQQAGIELGDRSGALAATVRRVSDPQYKVGKFTDYMYGLNEFTDSWARAMVDLEFLDRQLLKKDAQIPPELLDSNGQIRQDLTPDERVVIDEIGERSIEAMEAAATGTINTMGDFSRLAPWEKTFMKRLVTFWPWIRHQMSMSIRMPLSNPLRYAWMNSLTEMLGDDAMGEDIWRTMAGVMPVPTGVASLLGIGEEEDVIGTASSGMVPFLAPGQSGFGRMPGEVEGGGLKASLFDMASAGRTVSPYINTLTQEFGWDMTGGAGTSTPYGNAGRGTYGERVNQTPVTNPGQALWIAAGGIPAINTARDIAAAAFDPRPRYDTGEVIERADAREGNLLYQLARAGRFIPMPRGYDQELEEAERRERQRRIGG